MRVYPSTQVYEAQRSPVKFNPKRSLPRHIIIKLSQIKDKKFWERQERKSNTAHRVVSIDSHQISQWKPWRPGKNGMIDSQCWRKNTNSQPRIFYSENLSFWNEGEIKIFPDKPKPKEIIVTGPALQELLKGVS